MRELDDCTFEPQVNRSTSPRRDLQAYIQDQEDFEKKKNLKKYNMFCKLDEMDQSQRKVSMSRGSRKALHDSKELQDRSVELLYRQGVQLINSKSQTVLKDNNYNYTPSINKKSKVLSRESSTDLLYKEASERKARKEQRSRDYDVKEQLNQSRNSLHSAQFKRQTASDLLVFSKFQKEYEKSWEKVKGDSLLLLQDMKFVSPAPTEKQQSLVQDGLFAQV